MVNLKELLETLKTYETKLNENPDPQLFGDLDNLISELFNNKNQKTIYPNQNNQYNLDVNIKLLYDNSILPVYSKDGDAGLDLTVCNIHIDKNVVTYGFGISMEIPYGYVGLLFPRSSIYKQDLTLSNSVGVIDSGYRGYCIGFVRII